MEISVVIPVYGCRKALPELYNRLTNTLIQISDQYEIILVEDNCPQNSWEDIVPICKQDVRVKGIRLSRNFGQAHAITAGIDICSGNWVVVMDCDLQDRPEAISELYQKAKEGYDVVFARRVARKDTALTKWLSKCFYRVYDYFAGTKTDNTIGNFSIASKTVIDNYRKMREQNRTYQLFIRWLGFYTTSIDLEGDERFEGKSSYNLRRKIKFALASITAQSNKPLYISITVGFIISACAFIYILFLIIRYLTIGISVAGWTTVVASIYLMGGLILAAIGIVGIYIGNVFNETKKRPIYVVKESLNCDGSKDKIQ